MTKYQIEFNGNVCKAWNEDELVLCDHDYATIYDSKDEAESELRIIRNAEMGDPRFFVTPELLSIIEIS